jgi:DNA-binding CsgD family transcriptional regulator
MKFTITMRDRLALRQAALYAPWGDVRRRATILLHLANGKPVAALGRSLGASRPTVYKYARIFLHTRRVEDLRTEGIGLRDYLARSHEVRRDDKPAVKVRTGRRGGT